jgi:3-oxoisoapionate kinase
MIPLPADRPIFSYYGDDFTGSTDALEALALNGIPAVLFLAMPEARVLQSFSEYRAIGLAGDSRSQSPEWMSRHLPAIFGWLRGLGAPICQYKVCSTFDSSPQTGSIGRALEIGREVFQTPYIPIVVGAPHLKRYVVFGNLFAASGDTVYRIDRHPTMECHPVTPMDESDLRLHLARQTSRKMALLDILSLLRSDADACLNRILSASPDAVIFDGIDERSLRETGRLIWSAQLPRPTFAVGSSGFTHGLIDYWRSAGLIAAPPAPGKARPADRVIVISGSCSPVTERQIRWAIQHGFAGVSLDAGELTRTDGQSSSWTSSLGKALSELGQGRSVVLYSALGSAGIHDGVRREHLASRMGTLLRELLRQSGVKRAVIAGGDTSSHAGRQLGVHALTLSAPLEPGAPLCRVHSDDADLAGVELVFKGGQVGPDNFFEAALGDQR